MIKKKRIKKFVFLSIMLIFIINLIYNFSIEPPNYYESIKKDLSKLETLLEEVEIGNDLGQYSKNTIIDMKNRVSKAQVLINERNPDIGELRYQYKETKEDIKEFKNSFNKICLGKNEVRDIKTFSKDYNKTVEYNKSVDLEVKVLSESINKIEPINLEIKDRSVFSDFIKNIANDNNMKIDLYSFRHNGKFPSDIQVKVPLTSNNKTSNKFLYKYDEKNDYFVYASEAELEDNYMVFTVTEGGDWILSNKEPKKEIDKKEKDKNKNKEEYVDEEGNTFTEDEINEEDFLIVESSTDNEKDEKNENDINKESENKGYCTIEIRCDTILDKLDTLPEAKKKFIPRDGVILKPTKIDIKEGENVFDILKRATRNNGIQMEFRMDPLYSGAYVEGINHLYEFDGGELSGWMYKVDGWFPNYGCSRYFVKDGEKIVWVYTCNLGKDVGDQDYWKYNNE